MVAVSLKKLAVKLSSGAVKILETPLARREEAIAVRRGDLEFLEYLNRWVKTRRAEGWLESRRIKWFDHLEWYTVSQ